MAAARHARFTDLAACVGQQIGLSDWVVVDQARINLFADATGDHQWIHVDPARAAQGPFGSTVAHGFLTLALLPMMSEQAVSIGDVHMSVNYGLNKVRFPAPALQGSRLRGRFRLLGFEPLPGGAQVTIEVTMETEAGGKPVCVAEAVARHYTAPA